MATIKSGATADLLTIDPTSKAARVTLYDSAGREISFQSKGTFVASGTFTAPAAVASNDLVVITGSASKTVRVLSFQISTTCTAAQSHQFLLVKRSAADAGGTAVAATVVPFDSTFTGSATVSHYTASPTTPGTSVGTVNIKRVASPVPTTASWVGITNDAGVEMIPPVAAGLAVLAQPITLRGVAQQLALSYNNVVTLAGQTHAYTVVWSEE